jgi:class 3 adenylate cyclase
VICLLLITIHISYIDTLTDLTHLYSFIYYKHWTALRRTVLLSTPMREGEGEGEGGGETEMSLRAGRFKISPQDACMDPIRFESEDKDEEPVSTSNLSKPHRHIYSEKVKAYASYFVRHGNIFLLCLLVYLILLGASIAFFFQIAEKFEESSKETARDGVAGAIEHGSVIGLTKLASNLPALSIASRGLSQCADIVSLFPTFARTALSGADNPIRYYFDAAGEVASIYPPIDFDGMYYSNHSFMESQDDEYIRVMNRREVSMGLPFNHPDGYLSAYMYHPLWAPAAHASADVGCNSYNNCTDKCYDSDTKSKFKGMVRALINLNCLLQEAVGSPNDEYLYCFFVKIENSNDVLQKIQCSAEYPKEPIKKRFSIYGLTFVIELTRTNQWNERFNDPWAPSWKYRLSFFMAIAFLPFCMLLYWALVSQEKHTRLLSSILPRRVIDHLRLSIGVFSEEFADITILFSDICSFTPLAARLTPIQIVGMLDELYSLYDALTVKHGVYKIETIGDEYMVSCGCPEKVDPKTAALRMVAMAKDMLLVASNFRPSYLPKGVPFRVRVGINSGGVVAGVVGRAMPRYCLFGDVVNTASRMESTCDAMKIQISDSTFKLIEDSKIPVTARGFVQVKGKGSMKTYFVDYDVEECEYNTIQDGYAPIVASISAESNRNVAFTWLTEYENATSFVGSNTPIRIRRQSNESGGDCYSEGELL